MKYQGFDPQAPTCNVLLLGVYAPYNKTKNIDGYFQEFINLASSNGLPTDVSLFVKIREIDPAYFVTKGKLEEIKKVCDEHNIDHVVVSEQLSSQQERNLSDYLSAKVFDRTQLILEIFEKAAHSAEGKVQVEIAMLTRKKSRVAGKGIHMSQQSGIFGVRAGSGETAKDRELRHIETLILKLRKQLEQIEKNRTTQRKKRVQSGIPHLCLVGYTNAGKSTILNALTKSNVLAEDKLFATLDTTTRELYLDHNKIALISDTVGFIQNLPHQLITAFKSTLSELQFGDLLIEVIDATDPNFDEHIEVVKTILAELGVMNKDIVYVFNKIDQVVDKNALITKIDAYQPHLLVSAVEPDGLEPLKEFIRVWKQSHKLNA